METKVLISESINAIESNIKYIQSIKDLEGLNIRPNKDKWSVLDCLEHINATYRCYLPSFEKALEDSSNKGLKPTSEFKASFLGRMAANSMQPKKDGTIKNKMKTTWKGWDPIKDHTTHKGTLTDYLKNAEAFIDLLKKFEKADIQNTKVQTALRIWKLRTGDAIRFITAHEVRHIKQIENTLFALGEVKS